MRQRAVSLERRHPFDGSAGAAPRQCDGCHTARTRGVTRSPFPPPPQEHHGHHGAQARNLGDPVHQLRRPLRPVGARELARDRDRPHAGRDRLAREAHRRPAPLRPVALHAVLPRRGLGHGQPLALHRRRPAGGAEVLPRRPSRSTRPATRSSSTASCTRSSASATARPARACARRRPRSRGATARSSRAWTRWRPSCAPTARAVKLAEAITLYHVVVEASLAQPGQHMIERYLEEFDVLPGFREGMRNVALDEQRHIGFGVKLLADLYARGPRAASARRSSACCARCCPGRPPSPPRRAGTRPTRRRGASRSTTSARPGAASMEQKLRAIGLPVDDLPRFPLPMDLPPRERAVRGRRLLRANLIGAGEQPVVKDPEAVAILFDQMRRQADATAVRPARRSSGPSPTSSRGTSRCARAARSPRRARPARRPRAAHLAAELGRPHGRPRRPAAPAAHPSPAAQRRPAPPAAPRARLRLAAARAVRGAPGASRARRRPADLRHRAVPCVANEPRTRRRRARRARDARPHHHRHGHRAAVPGAVRGRLAGLEQRAGLERPDRLRDPLHDHRARRDGRLPPALHAPQLQDRPRAARRAGHRSARWRSRARSPPGSPTTASTTRSPTSPATRTPRTSTTAAGSAARCAASCTRTSAGSSSTRSAARRTATRPTCSATPSSRGSTARSSCGSPWACCCPFGLGWLIGGSLSTALTGLLWGGLVRMLVLHHMTYSINSLCHFFGRRRFETGDESRNLPWLAPLTSARPGTTTTTRSRPRPPTACGAGRSTPPPP